jgi:1-acyl-sn-glycerol-3-phosphate acyltransferase
VTDDTTDLPRYSLGTSRGARRMRGFVFALLRLLRFVLAAPYRVTGAVPTGPCVVAFHHTSHIDAFMLGDPVHRAGGAPIAMVKESVFRHWLAGRVVRVAGMIPVIRDSDRGREHAYDIGLQHLQAGHVVFIAPEGRIRRLDEFGHLRTGAARLAIEAGVPLVPAVTVGTERISGPDSGGFRFHRKIPIVASFGDPIPLDGGPTDATDRLVPAFKDLLASA